jgi:hypothetical protein
MVKPGFPGFRTPLHESNRKENNFFINQIQGCFKKADFENLSRFIEIYYPNVN